MKIKNAIFDLDGTLIDSMYLWRAYEVDILEELGGFHFSDYQRQKYLTMSLKDMVVSAEKQFSVKYDYKEVCARAISAMEPLYFSGKLEFKPYAVEFLKKLKNAGIGIALATATPKESCIPFLEKTGVLKYFDCILTTHDDIKVDKFKGPDIYDAALKALNADKETTVVFEDVIQCIKTCKNNGYYAIGIEDRVQGETVHDIKSLADRFITSYNEIYI